LRLADRPQSPCLEQTSSAVYRQSLAQYQKTVLVAYQEVQDQLAGLRILTGEAQSTADAVTSAQQAETIALNRYRGGLVSYLDVIYAQTALLANERTATQIGGQRMVAAVVLIKALGGGWLGVPAQPGTNPNPGAPGSETKARALPDPAPASDLSCRRSEHRVRLLLMSAVAILERRLTAGHDRPTPSSAPFS
jgi:outer membrane efflux protein